MLCEDPMRSIKSKPISLLRSLAIVAPDASSSQNFTQSFAVVFSLSRIKFHIFTCLSFNSLKLLPRRMTLKLLETFLKSGFGRSQLKKALQNRLKQLNYKLL